jgi:hypothetical protein
MRPDDADIELAIQRIKNDLMTLDPKRNKGDGLMPSLLEIRVDPNFESCGLCMHAADSYDLCVLRQCVHAIRPIECFHKKNGGANDGTDQSRGSL